MPKPRFNAPETIARGPRGKQNGAPYWSQSGRSGLSKLVLTLSKNSDETLCRVFFFSLSRPCCRRRQPLYLTFLSNAVVLLVRVVCLVAIVSGRTLIFLPRPAGAAPDNDEAGLFRKKTRR